MTSHENKEETLVSVSILDPVRNSKAYLFLFGS